VGEKPRTSATPGRRRNWLYGRQLCRSRSLRISRSAATSFYDYRHELSNVTFVNFEGQRQPARQERSLTCCLPSFGMSTNNTIQRAKIQERQAGCISHRWSISGATTITAMEATRTAVFHDVDGSVQPVSGTPSSSINDESDGLAHRPTAC